LEGDGEPQRKRALTPFPAPLQTLAPGARTGTASARRRAWLRHFRPDLEIDSLRGNVPTRLRRVADGDFDAILLAGAGVERLADETGVLDESLARLERVRLEPETFVPAPAQGALAVQCRADDTAILDALTAIDHAPTRAAVTIERAALALAEGGCDTAFGAFAHADAGGFALTVMLERDGRVMRSKVRTQDDQDLAAAAMAALDEAFARTDA
jgi:hydroxymethylbilane synthase